MNLTPESALPEGEGCRRVCGRLERFVDDGLSPLDRALDRGHLEACDPCRSELVRWLELLEGVGEAMQRPEPELARALSGLDDRLRAARATLTIRDRILAFPRTTVSIATAAAAVLLLFVLDLTGSGLPDQALATADLLPGWRVSLPTWSDLLGGLGGGAR